MFFDKVVSVYIDVDGIADSVRNGEYESIDTATCEFLDGLDDFDYQLGYSMLDDIEDAVAAKLGRTCDLKK